MATNEEKDIADLSDAELEARQRAEDGEDENTDPPAGDEVVEEGSAAAPAAAPAPEPPAATPAPTTAPAAAAPAAGAEPAKVEGVASKDGTRVLPYAALQAERRAARAATARAERAERDLAESKKLIEDLKAGKPLDEPITEADVAEMEANFPDEGKKMRKLFEAVKAAPTPAPAPAKDEDDSGSAAQEAIDQIPLLLDWQHGDQEKFNRAVEIDAVLMKSPKWVNKPAVERFTEVTRMVADEYDIPFTTPKASASPPPPAATPAPAAQAAQNAQRKPPETLSDFKGGSTAEHGSLNIERASPQALLARFQDMTDEEIDAQLAKLG